MGHSGRFQSTALGAEWEGHAELARLCEAARLTEREARVLLLRVRGLTLREVASALGLRSHGNASQSLRRAVDKLRQALPEGMQPADLARLLGLTADADEDGGEWR